MMAGLLPVIKVALLATVQVVLAASAAESGELLCWGDSSRSQLDVPADLGPVTQVAAVTDTCALTVSKTVRCWGSDENNYGHLNVPGDLGPVKKLYSGWWAYCAMSETNTMRCWGHNQNGKLDLPSDLGPVQDFAIGSSHSCAVKMDSSMACWSVNVHGRSHDVPHQYAPWKAVVAGSWHSCGLTTAGDMHCWGQYSPLAGPLASISGFSNIFCGLTNAGTTSCGGSAADLPAPTAQVTTMTGILASSAGHKAHCLITSTQSLFCYGDNSNGEVTVPDAISARPVLTVAAGWKHTCAVVGRRTTATTSTASTATATTSTATTATSTTTTLTTTTATKSTTTTVTTTATASTTTSTTTTATRTTTSSVTTTATTSTTTSTATTATASTTSTVTTTTTGTVTSTGTTTVSSTLTATSASSRTSAAESLTMTSWVLSTTEFSISGTTTTSSTPGTSTEPEVMFMDLEEAVRSAKEPCLTLTAVFDAEGRSSLVRGVEIFARCDVEDASQYGLQVATGGGKSSRLTLPRRALAKGAHYYAASESTPGDFAAFFGFPLDHSNSLFRALQGTSAVELLFQGRVVDVFGDPTVDGRDKAWDYTDGFATRQAGLPNGRFVLADWKVSGPDALQGMFNNHKGTIPVAAFKGGAFPSGAAVAELEMVTASLAGVTSLMSQGKSEATVETAAGALKIVNLQAVQLDGQRATVAAANGSRVSLPAAFLRDLSAQGGALVALPGNASRFQELRGDSGQAVGLASAPLDVSVYSADGRYIPLRLTEPMLIRLPGESGAAPAGMQQACAFLSTRDGVPFWSSEGVWRANDDEVRAAGEEPAGVWCFTNHLSIFAAIWEAILGCTNVEIFTVEAFRAFSENEGWYEARPVAIVFFLGALSTLLFLAGNAWETWAFRLGQTHAPGKAVHLCDKIISANLKLVKHKYTAIVVYCKEVIMSLRSGRHKLRTSSLTSGVQRFLALRSGIAVACVSQHCWSGGGWIESSAAFPKTTLCRKLEFHAGGAEDVMQWDMVGVSFLKVLKRFLMTFLALHPLLDAMRVGAGAMTAAKRTALQGASLFGALASNAIIFNFSGETKSWEAEAECPIKPGSQLFIIVSTLASILVNVIPNGFLLDLARQVHARPMWNLAFWGMTSAYLLASLLTLFLALANLNSKDQGKWYKALEWVCLIKFLVIPLAQAFRHSLLLEGFLFEDRKLPPSKQFPVFMGLRHPSEAPISEEVQKEAEQMALQAISAGELVKFAALLGDKVMLGYDPELSTSEEVMRQAIAPLCSPPPSLQDYPCFVEVVEAKHLEPMQQGSDGRFSCSILHLGQQLRQMRTCLSEHASPCMASTGQDRVCKWAFLTTVSTLEPEHALAFAVRDGNDIMGMACLTAAEVFREEEQTVTLRVHPTEVQPASDGERYLMPNVSVGQRSNKEVTASRGKALQEATILVRVRLPSGFLEALALNELWKLKKQGPGRETDVDDNGTELQARIVRSQEMAPTPPPKLPAPSSAISLAATTAAGSSLPASPMASGGSVFLASPVSASLRKADTANSLRSSLKSGGSKKSTGSVRCGAFCQTYMKDFLPPDRCVVHCRHGKFLHLLCTVLCDALKVRASYQEVERRVLERDFASLLEDLSKAESQETRYWIEIFAVDPSDFEEVHGESHWHEDLMPVLPTVMRSMRNLSCKRMVADIKAGREPKNGPMEQLLILDESCCFMHEKTCLAEMMLAKAMRVKQRLILHPELLSRPTLGEQLKVFGGNIGDASQGQDVPWTLPFLAERQAVYDRVRELVLAAVKVQRDDSAATLSELKLTDVAITVGAAELLRSGSAEQLRQPGDSGMAAAEEGGEELGAAD